MTPRMVRGLALVALLTDDSRSPKPQAVGRGSSLWKCRGAGMNAEFDNYARDYEQLLKDPIRERFASDGAFFHLRKWILLRRLLRRARMPAEELSWLDVGCGKGELLRLGASAFREARGCDPSIEMLRECGDLKVEIQPESKLPFADESFDVITAACVYHHLSSENQTTMTSEAHRVLRSGGIFVVFEHNPWNPATRIIVSRTPVDADAVLLTPSYCNRLLRQAGFKFSSTVHYLFLPEPLFRSAGWIENALTRIPLGGQYAVCGRRS